MVWLEFALCVVVIAIAGAMLSRYGDAIADKTGIADIWIGIVMLGTVTSLPEIVLTLSALSASMMTGIAIVGLFYRSENRVLKLIGWSSLLLFLVYLLNTSISYLYGG